MKPVTKPRANPWLTEAQQAADAYRKGKYRSGYPGPGATGLCARAARVLWETVHARPYPWIHPNATAMAGDLMRHGKGVNDYHAAVAEGMIKPGAWLFFGGNAGMGHVVTVVDVAPDADLAKSIVGVTVFENTSRKDKDGKPYGTHICPLADVLAVHGGTSGITWTAFV